MITSHAAQSHDGSDEDSDNRYRLLIDSVVDYAIFLLDPQGRVVSWNAGAERIKGYRATDIIGEKFSRFYPAEDIAAGKPERQLQVAAAEGRLEDEGWRLRKDGSRFWANVVITALRDRSGMLCGFGKVTRDLSRRREMEQALRQANDQLHTAVAELDAFSYSISHDLRAPLRALDGFSRILVAQHGAGLDPDARELLELLRENAVRMGHLIDDLLNLARLGRQPLTRRQVAVGVLVDEVVAEMRRLYQGRSVRVDIETLPDLSCDPVLLRRVYSNLIDNAFKYTRLRADARVEIGSRMIDGERVLFVRDNGAGFDMQYASKLFGVFQRLHRAEDFEGNGVGLAMVQRVVHRHHGRVWAEAAVDRGATFYFTLEGSHDA